ncbi:MAG: adaptor protein MecA [Acutalibacteraceae bacterium]|nr:adaptor protein MecA [Acutalibacteraceae bacterium]
MHIYFESERRFKVELDAADLRELDITYNQMDYQDEHTREVLQGLLKKIGVPGGFESTTGRIMIEVFPKSGDGCVVQYTSIDDNGRNVVKMRRVAPPPTFYEFLSVDDMLAATELIKNEDETPLELYLVGEKYRLVAYIERDERRVRRIMSEFAETVGKGAVAAAFTAEHGEKIAFR